MKKKVVLCALLAAMFTQNIYSQNQQKIDSLLNVLKTAKEDTSKVNTLNALGVELFSNNPDTSIILANQALSLSEKAKSKKHIADSYHLIARAYQVKGNYPSSLENNFKALSIREEIADKSGIAKSFGNIGRVYQDQADYPNALNYYFKALKIHEELENKEGIAKQLQNIGIVYSSQGELPKALDSYFKSLKMYEELDDKPGIAKSLNQIGNVYSEQSDYPKAQDYYFKSLKMEEELADKSGIAKSQCNIGLVYTYLDDYPKGLDYFFKALKTDEELGDKNGIAADFANIGMVYFEQEDYPKALDYYFKALKMAEQLEDKRLIAIFLGNIGNVYSLQKDYSKALDYNFKALKVAEELGNKNVMGFWLGNIGEVYIETGKFAEAEVYLKKGIAITENSGVMEHLWQFEESLSKLYDTTGRYKLAMEHYKKAMVIKDTLYNQEKNNEITRKEMNYEFEKTQAAEKAGHEKLLAVADVEIKKQKLLKYSLITGLGLVLILVFLGYRTYRTQQLMKLQTLRNKIASDLHDDVGSTLSSISIFSEMVKEQSSEVNPMLEQIGESSRKMLAAMADIVWTINPENDQFEKIILRMKSFAYELLGAKKIDFEFEAGENVSQLKLPMDVRKNLYLIFKEATNNLVKYSGADKASFSISGNKEALTMLIRDNGKGFDVNKDSEGNGLTNMKKRAKDIGANLLIESEAGTGTTLQLILNLA